MKQYSLIFMLIPLFVVIMMMSSCSKQEDRIMCYPKDATGCIGWAGNN